MKKFVFLIIFALCATLGFAQAKYIFYFIGDGMGFGAVSLTESYLAAKDGKHGSKNLSFSNFPVTGFATTYSENNLVTCSSAAGTALACGSKTRNGRVGVNAEATQNFKSIAYRLKEKGYKVGITTSVSIDHATPAVFYAHQRSRKMYYEIAQDLAKSGFDFFSGAGFVEPQGEDKLQPSIFPLLEKNGYRVSRSLTECKTSTAQKNILLQAESKPQNAYPYAIDKTSDDYTLRQTTEIAVEKLTNSKGFFLMVEGGKIDWASHDNAAAAMVGEVVELSDAVQVALDFYKKYPKQTLIVVTADHETGGLSVGSSEDNTVNTLELTTPAAVEAFFMSYGCYSTTHHTGTAVPVYAIGAGSALFSGKMDNTDIPKKIAKAAGVGWE
jgi:alkaline phosphatase